MSKAKYRAGQKVYIDGKTAAIIKFVEKKEEGFIYTFKDQPGEYTEDRVLFFVN